MRSVWAFAGLALAVSVLTSGLAAQASGARYPAPVRAVLARHAVWQTIVINTVIVPSVNNARVLTVGVSKKWQVRSKGRLAQSLKEITELSLGLNEETQTVAWRSNSVDLGEPVAAGDYYVEGTFQKDLKSQFRYLTSDRLELSFTSDSGFVRVIFVPSRDLSVPTAVWALRPVNVWTAPLGALKFVLSSIMHVSKQDTAYLHHDLLRKKAVVLDKSFPEMFRPVVERVLAKWNQVFARDFFYLLPGKTEIDIADCFSRSILCLNWTGSDKLPWSGVSGSAQPTFDPQSGLIQGGLVNFTNTADPAQLTAAPRSDVLKIATGQTDYDWIIATYLRKAEFMLYESPIPERIVESILLHELGHYNGFTHNFAGSLRGTAAAPSESIMDYIAFPAVGQFVDLGNFDREMVALVYNNQTPSPRYAFGSDVAVAGSNQERWVQANNFDIGDPAQWLIAMSKAGANGVYTTDPGGIGDLLSILAEFTDAKRGATESQISNVRTFLCERPSEIAQIQSRIQEAGGSLTCD